MTFHDWVVEHTACQPAIGWVGNKTIEEAWRTCSRPFWMTWLIRRSHTTKDVKEAAFELGFLMYNNFWPTDILVDIDIVSRRWANHIRREFECPKIEGVK